jgi:hypothetical protein
MRAAADTEEEVVVVEATLSTSVAVVPRRHLNEEGTRSFLTAKN